jgi:hypothetical protein
MYPHRCIFALACQWPVARVPSMGSRLAWKAPQALIQAQRNLGRSGSHAYGPRFRPITSVTYALLAECPIQEMTNGTKKM